MTDIITDYGGKWDNKLHTVQNDKGNHSTPLKNTIDDSSLQLELHMPNFSSIDSNAILQVTNSNCGDNCARGSVEFNDVPMEETNQANTSLDLSSENDISRTNDNQIDGSRNDPSYNLNENSDTISNLSSLRNTSSSQETVLVDHSVNIQTLTVLKANEKKAKRHFCPFCNTLQTKLSRHLCLKHKEQNEVQKFLHLPSKNRERRKLIAEVRKRGDYIHNTAPEFNSGILIVPRQLQEKSKNTAEDYVCCRNCKGFFAKTTIRLHYQFCSKPYRKGSRNNFALGRRMTGYIHEYANNTLRQIVFPVLRDDEVTRSIKYDELIIQFGNKLCDKYTLNHQHDMIRAQLRLLGRFKLELMSTDNSLVHFKDMFKPQNFNKAIDCLRRVAQWDSKIMWFRTPAVAQNLTTLIKKCCHKLRTECIKIQDNERQKLVENFLLLWEEEVPTLINKKALEDQITQKRQKKEILPTKHDIKLLYEYLKTQCNICVEILREKFDMGAWILLTQLTLVLTQIFNRRRAGEIERLTLTDYRNKEILNKNIDPDVYTKLPDSDKEIAQQFQQIKIRGKLGRTVPILLNSFIVENIQTILQFRREAGVKSNNDYVFSVPDANILSKKYFRACPLLRRFANECGAIMPSTLRGTSLRKQIATYVSSLNVEEYRIERLANHMGHHKDIHKNIYRLPIPVTEITDVSRLLMAAIGDDEKVDDQDHSEDENSNSDEDCFSLKMVNCTESSKSIDCHTTTINTSKNTSNDGIKRRSSKGFFFQIVISINVRNFSFSLRKN